MGNAQVLSKKRNNAEKYLIDFAQSAIMGELAGQIFHELNNPLQVVLGFAQDLLGNFPRESGSYQDISLIVEEARKCCQIVKNAQSFHLHRQNDEMLNLKLLVERVVSLLQYRLRKKKLQIELQLAQDTEPFPNDGQKLHLAIFSVLSSAVSNSIEHSAIKIMSYMAEDAFVLEVHYTPGIEIDDSRILYRKEFWELLEKQANFRMTTSVGKYTLKVSQ